MFRRLFICRHFKLHGFTSYHTSKKTKGIFSKLTWIYKNRLDKWIVLGKFLIIKLFVKIIGRFVNALNSDMDKYDNGMRKRRLDNQV